MMKRSTTAARARGTAAAAALALLLAAAPGAAQTSDGLPALDRFGPLARAFEAQAGDVRFLALLSPSCPYCMQGYRYMLRLMEEIPDPRLKVYIVWEPMLSGDSKALADRQARRADDPRVVYQAWDGDRVTGRAWSEVLDMDGIAWDVYFLYGAEAAWPSDGPSDPAYWQHQLPELRDRGEHLDYDELKAEIERLLDDAPPS